MKRLVFSAGLAFAVLPSALPAQELTPAVATSAPVRQPPPPSVEQIISAKARADAIITAAGAGDLFDNITTDATPKVKHKGSGMVCLFNLSSSASRITIFPGLARGLDVGCSENTAGVVLSTYATRPPSATTLEQSFGGAIASIRTLYPDAKPYEGKVTTATVENMPTTQETYFDFTDKDGKLSGLAGRKFISRLSMAKIGDWELKIRATTEFINDESPLKLSLVSGLTWLTTLGLLDRSPAT